MLGPVKGQDSSLFNSTSEARAAATQLFTCCRMNAGISQNKGHVHVMFIFRDPTSSAAFDDSLELAFKLPVRTEDDD